MKTSDKPLARETILRLLRVAKTETMKEIYGRLEPGEDGCIRTSMSPAGTETGRFNHRSTFLYEPGSTNLANLPKKTAAEDPLYRVRDVIVPHEGRLLGAADYSQAEARWCAYLAEDPERIRMYEAGTDQYLFFVSMLKHGDDKHMAAVSKPERNAIGKVGILAGQYGVSWKKILETVNADADSTGIAIDAKTAKRMVDIWPDVFPRTVQWWGEIRHTILSRGYLVNPFGRRRDFFGRRDSSSAEDSVVREAIAFGPQSANADMLNTALARLVESYDPVPLRVLLQVHDEIVFDCRPSEMKEVARLVRRVMEFPMEVHGRLLKIPVEVNFSSRSWGTMKQVAV